VRIPAHEAWDKCAGCLSKGSYLGKEDILAARRLPSRYFDGMAAAHNILLDWWKATGDVPDAATGGSDRIVAETFMDFVKNHISDPLSAS
jgi:hypothetical protein